MKKALGSVVAVLFFMGFVWAEKAQMRSAFEVIKCTTLHDGTESCDTSLIAPQKIEIELSKKASDSPDYDMWEGVWTKTIDTAGGFSYIGSVIVTRYVFRDGTDSFNVSGILGSDMSSVQPTTVAVWITSMNKLNDIALPGTPQSYQENGKAISLWPVLIMGAALQNQPFEPINVGSLLKMNRHTLFTK